MIQVNEANFESEIKDGVVIVDFSATWCGPCRYLTPILERIQGAKVVKVDIDQDPGLATRFDVSAVPKLVYFKDGQMAYSMVGVQSQQAIQGRVDRLNAK